MFFKKTHTHTHTNTCMYKSRTEKQFQRHFTDAQCWSEHKHEANHDAGKVARKQAIENEEETRVVQVAIEMVDADGKPKNEHVSVKEVARPHSRLRTSTRSCQNGECGALARAERLLPDVRRHWQ